MKLRILRLGITVRRELKATYAKNMKVLWVALWFFGIQISFGENPVDVIDMLAIAKRQAQQPQQQPAQYFNRSQRRRMIHLSKKQRHA